MPVPEFKTIDDYEAYLGNTFDSWPAAKRLAFAAATAERWFHLYVKFSESEDWGDHAALRSILESIWSNAAGQRLAASDFSRFKQQLHDSTPHMDDFDAPEALGVAMILSEAIDCAKTSGEVYSAVRSGLAAFEAAVPDWILEPEDTPKLWKQVAVRKERNKQFEVIELLQAIPALNPTTLATFRLAISRKALQGETTAEKEVSPKTLTNQTAFEQYRRLLENQLRSPAWKGDSGNYYMIGTAYYSQWASRYNQRLRAISGKGSLPIGDRPAHDSLLKRSQVIDSRYPQHPVWHEELEQIIHLCISQPLSEGDAKSIDQLHSYGPSLRAIWAQAKAAQKSDDDSWEAVMEWARHRPTSWQAEDQRRKQGLAHPNKAIGSYLNRTVDWSTTEDPFHPWSSTVEGASWSVRLNDFPDDIMYTLVVDGNEVGSFHDWPATWNRYT